MEAKNIMNTPCMNSLIEKLDASNISKKHLKEVKEIITQHKKDDCVSPDISDDEGKKKVKKEKKEKKVKKEKKDEKEKKAPSQYNLFIKAFIKTHKGDFPSKEMMVEAGKIWRNEEDKDALLKRYNNADEEDEE